VGAAKKKDSYLVTGVTTAQIHAHTKLVITALQCSRKFHTIQVATKIKK